MTAVRDDERYGYYFDRARPAAVQRLLERKHAALLDLATAGGQVGSVLEIGPGEGFVARAARVRGIPRYVALEATATGTGRLRQEGFDVRQAMVPPFPETEPVDLVYASHLVEHLPGPDAVLALLRACHDLLRPGGRVALAFPDARWMRGDFWDCDYTHQWPSTPRRVAQVGRDAGFRVRASHDCCLHLDGPRARALRAVARLYPQRLLSLVDPARDDFWYRGKLLLAPDALVVLEPVGDRPGNPTGG